jgi:phage terminase large subunit GpA-like protein
MHDAIELIGIERTQSTVQAILSSWVTRIRPPARLNLLEWATDKFVISREEGAEYGKWDPTRFSFQPGLLWLAGKPNVKMMTVMAASQLVKTTLAKALAGYHMDVDPCPMLYVMPTQNMASQFSDNRLDTMIRDIPSLAAKVPMIRGRFGTQFNKDFPGGYLALAWANSPSELASRPVRTLFLDEEGRYPVSAGKEGNPADIAIKRVANFYNSKVIRVSSPGHKVSCSVNSSFTTGTMHKFYIPCPSCDELHTLEWARISINTEAPDLSRYICPHCGVLYDDVEKVRALKRCDPINNWIAEHPEREEQTGHISVQLSRLYSPITSLGSIVREWIAAKNFPEKMQVFVNTVLGMPYEEEGDVGNKEELYSRLENYDEDSIPSAVLGLFVGIDVQPDRYELEVIGIGADEHCYGICYVVIAEDGLTTDHPILQKRLDDFLISDFVTQDGRTMRVLAACMDSSDQTDMVYQFCANKSGRNIWAIKGMAGPKPIWPYNVSQSKKHKGHFVRVIGVDTGKDLIHARAKIVSGPGQCHWARTYTKQWFEQFTAERRVTEYNQKGELIRTWKKEKGARNEALDCRNYAWAAYLGYKLERGWTLEIASLQANSALRFKPIKTTRPIDETNMTEADVVVSDAQPPIKDTKPLQADLLSQLLSQVAPSRKVTTLRSR